MKRLLIPLIAALSFSAPVALSNEAVHHSREAGSYEFNFNVIPPDPEPDSAPDEGSAPVHPACDDCY